MLRRFFVVTMIMALALSMLTSKLEAANPGGNNIFSARVFVYDQDNNPYQGIPLKLDVQTTGPWGPNICIQNGATDSQGWAYLECQVDPNYSETLDLMVVTMTNTAYAIGSSQNTSTSSYASIYPFFTIGLDVNENDVVDAWEMPLAQKFCPVLFAPLSDRGLPFGLSNALSTLRPVPVEIMDRDGPNGQPDGILDYHDVEVDVFQGQLFLGTFNMEDILFPSGNPYSNNYPDQILPESTILAQLPGQPLAWFVVRPYYEWATTNFPEDNLSWYSHWEQKISEHAGDTWYDDGTTYIGFDYNGNDLRINYLFPYPFNASAGRHEGDLPTIRVTVNSQDPSIADIISVSYPIHGLSSSRVTQVTYDPNFAESLNSETFNDEGNSNSVFANKYFVIDQTHPVSFGGGYLEYDGFWGYGSHAQYPCPGTWHRSKGLGAVQLDEIVEADGVFQRTVQFDFNNYQNIKIIPPRQYVVANLLNNTNFNWLVFGGWWGHPVSLPTAAAGNVTTNLVLFFTGLIDLLPFVEVEVSLENKAPLSPYKGSIR